MSMEKNRSRSNLRRKNISIRILEEDGYMISEILYVQYCANTDNIMGIHTLISYRERRILQTQICKEFSKRRDEIAKDMIRKLIENDHNVSCYGIRRVTGYGLATISRHYMSLKKTCMD